MRARHVIRVEVSRAGAMTTLHVLTTDGERSWRRRYETAEATALHAARCLAARYELVEVSPRRWSADAADIAIAS